MDENRYRHHLIKRSHPEPEQYIYMESFESPVSESFTVRDNKPLWAEIENNGVKRWVMVPYAQYNRRITFDGTKGKFLNITRIHGIGGSYPLKVFDAHNCTKCFVGFGYSESLCDNINMDLIDLRGCKLVTRLLVSGFNQSTPTGEGWYRSAARVVRINGCTNAIILGASGIVENNEGGKIYGLFELTQLQSIGIYNMKLCYEDDTYETTPDFSSFSNLSLLHFCKCNELISITIPSSLRTLNIPNCTGITDLSFLSNSNIETLNCANCTGITDLSFLSHLPLSLKTLNCANCTGITDLSFLSNSNIETLNCANCTGITDLSHLPLSLKTLESFNRIGNGRLINADFSYLINLERIEGAYGVSIDTKEVKLPPSIKYCQMSGCIVNTCNLLGCNQLTYFGMYTEGWVNGGGGVTNVPVSITEMVFGTSWGNWPYPMPDLTQCVNLKSMNLRYCKIRELNQQDFIDSFPTFTSGTHTIDLRNTGTIASTVSALQAKGWTVTI